MLEILVGIIGCGKSTYCKEAAKNGAIIVNDDSLVDALHAGMNWLYKPELKPLYKQIDYTIISYGLSHGYRVIVDRPNLNPDTRRRYIEIAKSLDSEVKCILFPFYDKEVHVSRRMNDSRGFTKDKWNSVYDRLIKEYKEPTLDEGYKEIIYYE